MNFSSILIKCLSSPCFATSFPLRFIHHSRTLSSFYQNTAYEIWKCNSSVSNAGARKGRGRRGVVRRKDLNIGQIIGKGRLKLAIPGLTTEIKIDDRSNKITEIGEDEEFDKRLQDSRNRAQAFRKLTVLSTERGWTGGHMGGRSAGKIEQVDNNQSGFDLESFQTRILYLSQKQIMTKVFGRKRRVRALVACGNGNGVVGLGAAVGNYIAPVLTKAKQRSARNLVHVYRNEVQSVLHDFAQSYGFAEMYVSRRGPGHGLICHRLIKTLCELIGIKNIYAKQIGTTNPVSMANAFLIGLLKQKSYQTIADEQRLLVVKMDPLWQSFDTPVKRHNYPELLAEPKDPLMEIDPEHEVDFDRICLKGRVPLTHIPTHHASVMNINTEDYYTRYLGKRIHPKRYHRKKLVESLAIDDFDDSKWRYPFPTAPKITEISQ